MTSDASPWTKIDVVKAALTDLSTANEESLRHEILRQRQEIQRLHAEAAQNRAHIVKMGAEIRILREKLDELTVDQK